MAKAALPVLESELTPDGGLILRDANAAAERAFSMDRVRVIGLSIEDAFPFLASTAVPRNLELVARTGEPGAAAAIARPEGWPVDKAFQVSAFQTAPNWVAAVFADIGERVRAERVLRQLVDATSARGGPDLVRDITVCLSRALSADVVFVGEVLADAPHRMAASTLAIDGVATDGVVFDLDSSPCGDVLAHDLRCIPAGSPGRYPDDLVLQLAPCACFVGVPLRDSDGRPLGVLAALFRDAPEDLATVESVLCIMTARIAGEMARARFERELLESEQRFRALVQHSSDVTVVIDYGGIITFGSPSATRTLGYPPGSLLGKSGLDLVHPDDLGAVQTRLVDLARGDVPADPVVVRLRKCDGSWLYLEIVGENLIANPQVRGFLLTGRDIAERRRAEEARRVSERRIRSYFDAPMVGAAIWLPDGQCVEVNDRMCELLGCEREELLGTSWTDITYEDDIDPECRVVEELVQGRSDSRTREKRYRRKDGTILYARAYTGCVRGPDGEVDHYVSVVEELDHQGYRVPELLAG